MRNKFAALGIFAGLTMATAMSKGNSNSTDISEANPKRRKNKPSRTKGIPAKMPEYYGSRNKAVLVLDKAGNLKPMKIKNALKKGLQF